MRRRDPGVYLEDIQTACAALQRYTEDRTYQDYLDDDMFRSAVERQFITIGEAIGRLRRLQPSMAGRITARDQIVAFRNHLVHGYEKIDHEAVWSVLENDLWLLSEEVDELLVEADRDSGFPG